ncbi:HNH endonuclease family protein [Streptomyces sp. NPDC127190]|uniref:HNH endonuclease family protein n=1 Tax=unclassified Streptomyces TaxID=2593676 RepID=UPI00362C73CB
MRADKVKAVLVAAVATALLSAVMPASAAVSGGRLHAEGLPLRDAVAALPVADEHRQGYDRLREFGTWIDADKDGCNTRKEVLIEEAVEAPVVGPGCSLTGGRWYSYYDDAYETGGLDIDHLVPLAEAWDSGAYAWTKAERVAYANDLADPVHLVAVTAKYNRQKADKDVADWLPPYEPARCRYITEWTHIKMRYHLSVDAREKAVLTDYADACPNVPVSTDPPR